MALEIDSAEKETLDAEKGFATKLPEDTLDGLDVDNSLVPEDYSTGKQVSLPSLRVIIDTSLRRVHHEARHLSLFDKSMIYFDYLVSSVFNASIPDSEFSESVIYTPPICLTVMALMVGPSFGTLAASAFAGLIISLIAQKGLTNPQSCWNGFAKSLILLLSVISSIIWLGTAAGVIVDFITVSQSLTS